MRWRRADPSWVVRTTAAMAHRYANRGRSSIRSAAATEPQGQGERSTDSILVLGNSQASERTSAVAVAHSWPRQCLAPSAAIGSREGAAELLAGIAEALVLEGDTIEDEDVAGRLLWLLVDVLDAQDAIASHG